MGNVFGEGFVLGGVFVIGQQGIFVEHREMEFGDKVNIPSCQKNTTGTLERKLLILQPRVI